MIELPSTSFTFGNYNADIPFGIYIDSKKLLEWLKDHDIVGYSKTTSFKNQEGYVAVLIDLKEHGEYWSHIPENIFNKLIG